MGLTTYPTRPWAARTSSSVLMVNALAFVATSLQVLVVGAFWGSWIGLSRSIDTLTPATFLEVGHVMMADYGPIMSVLMPASVLLTLLTALFVYAQQPVRGLLVGAGGVCFVAATATTLLVNVPIDVMMAGWTLDTLPSKWMDIRDQWEAFHTLRTFVTLGGLAATLGGLLMPAAAAVRTPRPRS